jgi:hypothetical protein
MLGVTTGAVEVVDETVLELELDDTIEEDDTTELELLELLEDVGDATKLDELEELDNNDNDEVEETDEDDGEEETVDETLDKETVEETLDETPDDNVPVAEDETLDEVEALERSLAPQISLFVSA